MTPVRALVTGGAGFIGSHLADRLLADGFEVRILDNFSTGRRSNIAAIAHDVEIIEGDVQSYERTSRAAADCELIFHQAALPSVPRSVQDPLTSNATNVIGTLNVLLAARDHHSRRVVYASSSSVYGANGGLPKREEMRPLPISPYATAKLAGEGYCLASGEAYGLETVALRYFNVFGPRQDPASDYAAVIPRFITALLADEPTTVFGDGEQSRDFTFVDNVVEANLLAARTPQASGQVYNVACGRRTSIRALLAELRALLGSEVPINWAPPRPGEVTHSVADLTHARVELGYEPKVDLREGLSHTVAAIREGRRDHRELARAC